MAVRREETPKPRGSRRAPARTPQDRELEMVSLSYDLAEEQIRAGTASAQLVTHFVKLGSSREMLEQERMRGEIQLNKVKEEHMATLARMEDTVSDALKAFKSYAGQIDEPVEQGHLD